MNVFFSRERDFALMEDRDVLPTERSNLLIIDCHCRCAEGVIEAERIKRAREKRYLRAQFRGGSRIPRCRVLRIGSAMLLGERDFATIRDIFCRGVMQQCVFARTSPSTGTLKRPRNFYDTIYSPKSSYLSRYPSKPGKPLQKSNRMADGEVR